MRGPRSKCLKKNARSEVPNTWLSLLLELAWGDQKKGTSRPPRRYTPCHADVVGGLVGRVEEMGQIGSVLRSGKTARNRASNPETAPFVLVSSGTESKTSVRVSIERFRGQDMAAVCGF